MTRSVSLEQAIPVLVDANYEVTSDEDPSYNCAAWAVYSATFWLDPTPQDPCVWPEGLPRSDVSIGNFARAYELPGYTRCDDGSLEEGFDKIVIYGLFGEFQHVARQMEDGRWASKCGGLEDIVHDTPEDLEGDADAEDGYGEIAIFMHRQSPQGRRPVTSQLPPRMIPS